MNSKVKKILASFVVAVVLFGWYVTVFGIGSTSSIKDAMKFGLDINGGVYVVMEATGTDATGAPLKKLMDQTRAVLNNRVNAMGISEATVSLEGENRIRIEMPGVANATDAIAKIGQTAQLKFLLADGTVALDGTHVKDAGINTDSTHGGYKLELTFDSEGSKLFEKATATALSGTVTPKLKDVTSSEIAIALDDVILTHPEVQDVISGGSCEITQNNGGYTKEEATSTAALIRGGALPVSLTEVTSSVQTATIGVDALNKSVVAGLIGLGIIFLMMLTFYYLLGLVADIALLLYVIIVMWAMASMGSVLTLPGIAGIILSIGMAVDANVIIFARIKEEICAGKSIRVSVEQGFKHALTTVLDAQITTLIAAIVLYEVGTTSVKGFALTLMLGIIISIFTAVVITQLFINIIAESKKFSKKKFFGVNEDNTPKQFINPKFHFMNKRKIFYAFSSLIIITGLIFGIVRGYNYGIDFTGGTMIQIEMHEQVKTSDVEKTISSFDLNPTIVLAGDNNTQVIIKTIKALDNKERAKVIAAIGDKFNITEKDLLSSEEFGPTVGKELKANALKAIFIAMIGMLIYIIFRFKSWKYGIAAISGIVHDVLVLLACYAIFNVTVNNPFIAGILTVVGYSINDTIVIFDRIRENRRIYKKDTNEVLLDRSINQTLNRSIMTSLTTLIVMVPLFIMVSSSIREFVLPLMIGVTTGTYSSICLCSPLLYEFDKKAEKSKYISKSNNK